MTPAPVTRLVPLGAAAALYLLSALAHGGGGWPAQRRMLVGHGVAGHDLEAMAAGWLFGSACMLGLGLMAARAVRQARRGEPVDAGAHGVMGAAYALFGVGAAVAGARFNPFFLLFVANGALHAWGARWSRA